MYIIDTIIQFFSLYHFIIFGGVICHFFLFFELVKTKLILFSFFSFFFKKFLLSFYYFLNLKF